MWFCLRLPSVGCLNGSIVTEGEREDAERFFIRYYRDYSEEELPQRYNAFNTERGSIGTHIYLANLIGTPVPMHISVDMKLLNIRRGENVIILCRMCIAFCQRTMLFFCVYCGKLQIVIQMHWMRTSNIKELFII